MWWWLVVGGGGGPTYYRPLLTQGHSMRIFVRKMSQRCGVWQLYNITSPDQAPGPVHQIKHVRFWVLFTNEVLKGCKNGEKYYGLVWCGMVWYHHT